MQKALQEYFTFEAVQQVQIVDVRSDDSLRAEIFDVTFGNELQNLEILILEHLNV